MCSVSTLNTKLERSKKRSNPMRWCDERNQEEVLKRQEPQNPILILIQLIHNQMFVSDTVQGW